MGNYYFITEITLRTLYRMAILKKLNTIIQVGKMASEVIHACTK